jgi:hypothetical protein
VQRLMLRRQQSAKCVASQRPRQSLTSYELKARGMAFSLSTFAKNAKMGHPPTASHSPERVSL